MTRRQQAVRWSICVVLVFFTQPLAAQVGTTTASLNVRKGPGTSYGKVRTLPKNSTVTIYKERHGWCLITPESSRPEWVAKRYLTIRPTVHVAPPVERSASDWKIPWVGELKRSKPNTAYLGCPVIVVGTVDDTYIVRPYPYAFGYEDLPSSFAVGRANVRPLFKYGKRLRIPPAPKHRGDIRLVRFGKPQEVTLDGNPARVQPRAGYFLVDERTASFQPNTYDVIWHDGRLRSITPPFSGYPYHSSVAWDFDNTTIAFQSGFYSQTFFSRYYRFWAAQLLSVGGWFFFTLVLTIFFMTALYGFHSWRDSPVNDVGSIGCSTAFVIGCLLLPSGCAGENINYYKTVSPYLEAKTLPSGQLEPIFVDVTGARGNFFDALGVLLHYLFIPLVSVAVVLALPFFVAQTVAFFHYAFVPHPAEEEVDAALRENRRVDPEKVTASMYNPFTDGVPPAWKSRNWSKRLKDLQARIRAESDVMRETIDRERRRPK